MVNAASWTGTNLDDLASLAVHDDGFSHLVAWLLVNRELGPCAVRLKPLNLQLHILIPPQGSAQFLVDSLGPQADAFRAMDNAPMLAWLFAEQLGARSP
jgi:hypothetical protein